MRKLWICAFLTAAVLVGGTANAFNTEGEIMATINGRNSLYTAYGGQPIAELRENFKGAPGWKEHVIVRDHTINYSRVNSDDEFKKTGVYGQIFRIFFSHGPSGVKRGAFWYVDGKFPDADYIVWSYTNDFFVSDETKAAGLYNRFKQSLIARYGRPSVDQKIEKNGKMAMWSDVGVQIILKRNQSAYSVMVRYQQT